MLHVCSCLICRVAGDVRRFLAAAAVLPPAVAGQLPGAPEGYRSGENYKSMIHLPNKNPTDSDFPMSWKNEF